MMLGLNYQSIDLVRSAFEEEIKGYSVNMISYNQYSKIYILNDSLVILFEVSDYLITFLNYQEMKIEDLTTNKHIEPGIYENKAYYFRIVELVHNDIGFKHNNIKFKKKIKKLIGEKFLYIPIDYERFKGYTRLYWCTETPTDAEKINEELPELKLRERYESWQGVLYNLIYLEFTSANNKISRAVAYTTTKPDTYINSLCKKIVATGNFFGSNMRSGNDGYSWNLMNDSFNSWKGMKRVKRLEENLKYFYVQEFFKEKEEV